MNTRCYKCIYFYFYIITLVTICIALMCNALNDISKMASLIQSICACVNVVLIYLIYKWAKKDRTMDDKYAYKMKWFMDFLLPEYASMLKSIIEKEKRELSVLIGENNIKNCDTQNINRYKDEVGVVVINYSYQELEAINRFYYFNDELVEMLQKEINYFYDNLIEKVILISSDNIGDLKGFESLLSEHYNKIMEIIYKNVLEQADND